MMKKLEDYVRMIPDFPEPGVMFRDSTTIFKDPDGFALAIDGMLELLKDVDYDLIVGSEARGFVFGAALAYAAHKGFVVARKKGKLPCETVSAEYELEYGTDVLEMHKDAIDPGQKIVIVDDLVATGGTTQAVIDLVEQLGGEIVKILFVMELGGLKGREKLAGYDVESLIYYEGK